MKTEAGLAVCTHPSHRKWQKLDAAEVACHWLVLDELRSAGNLITILSSVAGWTNGHRQIYLSYGEDGQSRIVHDDKQSLN